MSDDHFDQKRDSSNQREGQSEPDEGAKTELVDLDALRSGASEPQFAPPPTMDSGPEDDDAVKTEMFEMPEGVSGGDDAITSSASSYETSDTAGGQPQPDPGNMSSVDTGQGDIGGVSSGSGQQVVIGGDDAGPGPGGDDATQFINVNDFANNEDAHFTPEQEQAGYDGSTQFVDINALQAGADAAGGDPIDNDQDLHRGYQFTAGDIRRGDVTLIHAKNPLGKDVLLKRVWEGDPSSMSTPLRERIAQLNELTHPNLLGMNGMFVSDSGMWVELQVPPGQSLTELIEEQGPLPTEKVLEWARSIVDVLETVHSAHLAYANLTTDSVWIADDTVYLEPFDMLRIEERGNLGAFGPPEMDAPPDERELSPATDVYSLATVITAAITGLPLDADSFSAIEDKDLGSTLHNAVDEDPDNRPQTIGVFLDELEGGGGLDIKVVGGAVFALLFLMVGALAVITDDDSQEQPPPEQQQETADAEDPAAQGGDPEEVAAADDSEEAGEETEDATADAAEEFDADGPTINLPGTVADDPRLAVGTSYELNPPDDASESATDEQLDEWRNEARELADEAEEFGPESDERFDHISGALQLAARLLRIQDDPSEDDIELWQQLYSDETVQNRLDEYYQRFSDPLLEGQLDIAGRRYRDLARLDPNARAHHFLDPRTSADVVELSRQGEDDDE